MLDYFNNLMMTHVIKRMILNKRMVIGLKVKIRWVISILFPSI